MRIRLLTLLTLLAACGETTAPSLPQTVGLDSLNALRPCEWQSDDGTSGMGGGTVWPDCDP
jgi:hypothetical protein